MKAERPGVCGLNKIPFVLRSGVGRVTVELTEFGWTATTSGSKSALFQDYESEVFTLLNSHVLLNL
jgi:hypothetical protein